MEVVQLQAAGVVLIPKAALAAEGRDAAFDTDARAREGGEVAGGADEPGGLIDLRADFPGPHGARV